VLAADAPPAAQLKEVEGALEAGRMKQAEAEREAELLGAEIAKLRIESVAAAQLAQRHESEIGALEAQLEGLNTEETAKIAALRTRQAEETQLLMALERLARHPPEALALGSAEPVDAVRGAMLLGAALPRLEAKAKALEAELDALAALRQRIDGKKRELVTLRDARAEEQQKMGDLIQRKAALQARIAQRVEIGAQRLAQLSAQANDLRELIERLEAERKQREEEARKREEEERQRAEAEQQRQNELLAHAMTKPPRAEPEPRETATAAVAGTPRALADPSKPKGLRPFAAAKGAMVAPAAGHLARRYGEPDEMGTTSRGLTIETQPGAQVVAPFDGRIEFAGPFRGYGQILIIEHGDGYHSLLAGLGRIDGAVGQWLVAGEPVGAMDLGQEKPALYLELRRNGQPINPLPWLAIRDEKVTG
jgi:murein hydrolase activator